MEDKKIFPQTDRICQGKIGQKEEKYTFVKKSNCRRKGKKKEQYGAIVN